MSTIEKALAKQKAQADKTSTTEVVADNKVSAPSSNDTNSNDTNNEKTPAIANPPKTLIELNKDTLEAKGFIYDTSSRRIMQEEFRSIKRKLINNAFGKVAKTLHHSNLIMITSSNPNEGKTFVSINLALSIALEQDKTVLLVDADVLRPSINNELEFSARNGLVEYLLAEVPSVKDIIYNTNIKNFKIIPAGKQHDLTNELLASDRMAALASELAERYPDRIVIFDCPPILGVTETPVLANLMGQAVVVVEESKTKIDDVIKATKQLNENLAIGLVMNKTLKSAKDTYGYYGYGYGKKAN
jgi:receptor protein-tyrosine kinase